MAVASARPYASLHLAPDRQPRQHLTTQVFYRLDALPAAQPTASKHWRQILPSGTLSETLDLETSTSHHSRLIVLWTKLISDGVCWQHLQQSCTINTVNNTVENSNISPVQMQYYITRQWWHAGGKGKTLLQQNPSFLNWGCQLTVWPAYVIGWHSLTCMVAVEQLLFVDRVCLHFKNLSVCQQLMILNNWVHAMLIAVNRTNCLIQAQ